MGAPYSYRVFISYSHVDRPKVIRLANLLSEIGMSPMWDQNLSVGFEFSPEILKFITNAHVFLPLITTASMHRPWFNQEIGFAVALGKPVLPVTLGDPPMGIIAPLHAIRLDEDLTDVATRITAGEIARLVDAGKHRAMYECTADNAQRAQLLADYANGISDLDRWGCVRQRASLTTFHLPSHGPEHRVWNDYFAGTPNQRVLFEALLAERLALDTHARKGGCRLIIDALEVIPRVYRMHGSASIRVRIAGLIDFLRDDSVHDVVIAINDDIARHSSITLVGDWFSSEALTSAVSGSDRKDLTEALFTRHQQTVLKQKDRFDRHIHSLLANREWTEANSRVHAISELEAFSRRLPE